MRRCIGILLAFVLICSFAGCGNRELSNDRLQKTVAEKLGVPDETGVECGVSEMLYWDAAERYYKNITFSEDGETVAGASVDPYTGELLKNIMEYDSVN